MYYAGLIGVGVGVQCRYCLTLPPPTPPPVQVEKERLQGQVVNSPQRILREVADQQQALDQVIFLLLVLLLLLLTTLLRLVLPATVAMIVQLLIWRRDRGGGGLSQAAYSLPPGRCLISFPPPFFFVFLFLFSRSWRMCRRSSKTPRSCSRAWWCLGGRRESWLRLPRASKRCLNRLRRLYTPVHSY